MHLSHRATRDDSPCFRAKETPSSIHISTVEDQPEITQGVEIDFDEISPEVAARILDALGPPLYVGMQLEQIKEVVGPIDIAQRFVKDHILPDQTETNDFKPWPCPAMRPPSRRVSPTVKQLHERDEFGSPKYP